MAKSGMSTYVLHKLREWYHSPLLFVTECIKATPSEQQAQALVSFGKNKRTSIRSGHGTGKDAFASWVIFWFMTTRPYAKVACTAPTSRQLGDILWSELSKWQRKSDILQQEFIVQKDKIFHKSAPKEWWCRAISPAVKASKEEQAETLAGLHGDHLLLVVDEASGVPDPVYVPLEGAMTQEDNRCLLIGNPTRNTGYFHDTQFHPQLSKGWNKFHWDSRESTNVSKEMVEYFKTKYGEDSNVFRIRVAGEPPLDDESTFIPLSWALQCVGNEITVDEERPVNLGVDVARFGTDASVILPRQGDLIMPWQQFKHRRTTEVAQEVVRTASTAGALYVGVDGIGVGGGVVDWLIDNPRGLGAQRVFEVNSYDASSDNKKWHRLREEIWDEVRIKCQKGRYSFPDEIIKMPTMSGGIVEVNMGQELAQELASVKYKFDNKGAIQLESKEDMKKRGVNSPNIGDALAISEYFEKTFYSLYLRNERQRKKNRAHLPGPDDMAGTKGRHSWMTC